MGRWRDHLNPDLSKHAWTVEEGQKLEHAVAQMGGEWAKISKLYFPGTPLPL